MTPGHHPPPQTPDDQAGHPDLDSLADLDAGLTDPATTARLTQHVRGCPGCTAVLAALDAVRADLRRLPAPPLPDPVAARLDATLAELRAGRPAAAGAGPTGPTGPPSDRAAPAPNGGRSADPVADLAAARDRRRDRARRLTTLAAASVAVLAAIVGIGTAVLHHPGQGSKATSAQALPDQGSGERSSGSSAPGRAATPQHRAESGGTPAPDAVPPAAPEYTRQTLAAALPAIETEGALAVATAAGVQGPAGAMADQARLGRCAGSIPDPPGTLTAVQHVLFDGTPGYVFVYRTPGGGLGAVVVGASCGVGTAPPTVLYRLPS